MDEIADRFTEALLAVDKNRCANLMQSLSSRQDSFAAMEEMVSAALKRIGNGWEEGSVCLAQVYMAGVICEELLETHLSTDVPNANSMRRVAMAVLLDQHALGKRIVLALAKIHGYHVDDWGCGLDVETLVDLVQKNDVRLLLISTLMLHAAFKVSELKELLNKRGCKTRVVVGGAPFRLDPELWQRVGADGYCRNALDAVEILKQEAERGV